MPRTTPETRFEDLIDAATRVFIAQGFRRTQMADVAEALGVAKGTLYLCVQSKEALFDAVLRCADAPRPIPLPRVLTIPIPAAGRTLRYVRERLSEQPASPTLRAALAGGRSRSSRRASATWERDGPSVKTRSPASFWGS